MSYTSEHRRLAPVLAYARRLDIATNPVPEAVFEALSSGFNIWCTPEDHPQGWDGITLIPGAFAKPCGFVGTATWKWDGEQVVGISLGTDAYDLADQRPEAFSKRSEGDWISIHNRPEDIEWAAAKVRWLFEQAGIPCSPVMTE
jgi:hypothetical protein